MFRTTYLITFGGRWIIILEQTPTTQSFDNVSFFTTGSPNPGGKMTTGAKANPPISHEKQKGKQIRYKDLLRKSRETLVKDTEPDQVLLPIGRKRR